MWFTIVHIGLPPGLPCYSRLTIFTFWYARCVSQGFDQHDNVSILNQRPLLNWSALQRLWCLSKTYFQLQNTAFQRSNQSSEKLKLCQKSNIMMAEKLVAWKFSSGFIMIHPLKISQATKQQSNNSNNNNNNHNNHNHNHNNNNNNKHFFAQVLKCLGL